MHTNGTPAESYARSYARLLLRLHALLAEGKGETEEADVIRDDMDAPWHAMGQGDQERLRGLSEDLHALTEGHPNSQNLPPEEKARWYSALRNGMDSADRDAVLRLLRRPPSGAPFAALAFIQALCWEALGYEEVAQHFRQHAERIKPKSDSWNAPTIPHPV